MSLAFLNLKGWHPSNKANQKKIWIAEQEALKKKKDEESASKQVERNTEVDRYISLATGRGDKQELVKLQEEKMSFMYQKPPGIVEKEATILLEEESTEGNIVILLYIV